MKVILGLSRGFIICRTGGGFAGGKGDGLRVAVAVTS